MIRIVPTALAVALTLPSAAAGQLYTSIGGGPAFPTGDLGDAFGSGFTVRGQAGLSFVLVDAHVQAGYTRFGSDVDTDSEAFAGDDWSVFHTGIGARVGLGLVWVGANAAYFFGDGDDEIGFFPEVGVGLGPIEVVADYRIGDPNWGALRAALKV